MSTQKGKTGILAKLKKAQLDSRPEFEISGIIFYLKSPNDSESAQAREYVKLLSQPDIKAIDKKLKQKPIDKKEWDKQWSGFGKAGPAQLGLPAKPATAYDGEIGRIVTRNLQLTTAVFYLRTKDNSFIFKDVDELREALNLVTPAEIYGRLLEAVGEIIQGDKAKKSKASGS